ncbi:MAG TPA: precorrin-6y C5,15-methyltransferase (decarboxylating) subunit CbiE [Actinocrinis sp.]|nr:precorrin-6y C5,15-methyltransferase (decarboxylating) subunit CbiE [Actinocrinis sp.]
MTPTGDLTVIGLDGSTLSADARTAIERATLVVGGARHLDAVLVPSDARTVKLGPLAPAITALSENEGPAVVLASGDPGFFGILRALSEGGLEPRSDRVIPATSSVAIAFARVGLPWDDALVVSMHGSGDGRDLRRAANVCRAHPKVALLTGPGSGVRELARELMGEAVAAGSNRGGGGGENGGGSGGGTGIDGSGGGSRRSGDGGGSDPGDEVIGDRRAGIGVAAPERTLVVAARLGERDESVERLTLRQAAERDDFSEPNVVLCLADRPVAPRKRWLAGWTGDAGPWALAEDRYEHRDAQITKAEVRAQVLARLAPAPGSLIWDLGAGSGSVGIECARFGAAAVAVERDAESCARIAANAAAHGVEIAVVHGAAPEILAGLPVPDAVFVGGGGTEVVRAALAFGPRRVVVALAAVERVGEVVALLREDAEREVDGVLLQASRLTALPVDAHRFAARNPVFVVWGDRP